VQNDPEVQDALQRRLDHVDEEISDLRALLAIIHRLERDDDLREMLRTADLGFRLQDLLSGKITGAPLRRALATLDALTSPAVARR
jgi:hypothetical protein